MCIADSPIMLKLLSIPLSILFIVLAVRMAELPRPHNLVLGLPTSFMAGFMFSIAMLSTCMEIAVVFGAFTSSFVVLDFLLNSRDDRVISL